VFGSRVKELTQFGFGRLTQSFDDIGDQLVLGVLFHLVDTNNRRPL
jgi:hypothetical protein